MGNMSLAAFERELKEQGVQFVRHSARKEVSAECCRLCVLGVLLTPKGKAIEEYMLSQLTQSYQVVCIRQEAPGRMFEYPALRYAQLYSLEQDEPVLYLHTKGAANPGKVQKATVNMWMHEFVEMKTEYEARMDSYDLLMPYSGPQNITWMNGFIATPKAFSSIPDILPSDNRFVYEILFRDSTLSSFGRRLANIKRTKEEDNTASMYEDILHFSDANLFFSRLIRKFVGFWNKMRKICH